MLSSSLYFTLCSPSTRLLFPAEIAPPPTLEYTFSPSAFSRAKTQLLNSEIYSVSSCTASLLSHTQALMLHRRQPFVQHTLSPPFTWLCEIPMQLPILYSMSSSGEVTLALHGWQSTFLQNCIVISQTQHCQSAQISAGATEWVCARLCCCISASVTNKYSALHCLWCACDIHFQAIVI